MKIRVPGDILVSLVRPSPNPILARRKQMEMEMKEKDDICFLFVRLSKREKDDI